jgi:hypothetical protein
MTSPNNSTTGSAASSPKSSAPSKPLNLAKTIRWLLENNLVNNNQLELVEKPGKAKNDEQEQAEDAPAPPESEVMGEAPDPAVMASWSSLADFRSRCANEAEFEEFCAFLEDRLRDELLTGALDPASKNG